MKDCIFCGISGSAIYDDGQCFVVPDKYPSQYGHMLVISKEHETDMLDAPGELVAHMFVVAQKVGGKLRKGLKSKGMQISTNIGKDGGQVIPHFHIHILPFNSSGAKDFVKHKEITEAGAAKLRKLLD